MDISELGPPREAGWVDDGDFAFWLLGQSFPVTYSCLTEFLSLKSDVPSTLSHWAGCFLVSLCVSLGGAAYE